MRDLEGWRPWTWLKSRMDGVLDLKRGGCAEVSGECGLWGGEFMEVPGSKFDSLLPFNIYMTRHLDHPNQPSEGRKALLSSCLLD